MRKREKVFEFFGLNYYIKLTQPKMEKNHLILLAFLIFSSQKIYQREKKLLKYLWQKFWIPISHKDIYQKKNS
jgi:hypothetical protein